MTSTAPAPRLWATSDLHVGHRGNFELLAGFDGQSWPADWVIVAGDIGEKVGDIEQVLRWLRARFARVIWTPGNHELWTTRDDPVRLDGPARYAHLVELCRRLGVLTPEDPYPIWRGVDGDFTIAPIFQLYDYTFRREESWTKEQALQDSRDMHVVCTDEYLLNPSPFPTIDAWCRERVRYTTQRLDACDPDLATILVSHWPLVRDPTRVLRYPSFALWCGTTATADWHRRYRAALCVYGHLHIPRGMVVDGVPFEEVSLGYPREWQARASEPPLLRELHPRYPTDRVS